MSRRGKHREAGTPALLALEAAGVQHTVRAYEHADGVSDFGAEAARELGVDPERVYKTLVLSLGSEKELGVAVVPVSARLDLKAAAHALGVKRVEMADPQLAARRTGYVPGGISPLGQRHALPTVLHVGALEQESILVSAGRRGLDVELAPADLVTLTHAVVAPVATR